MHRYGQFRSSILEDEDIQEAIQFKLMEHSKSGYICAEDVVEIFNSPELQELLAARDAKLTISVRTARQWLKKLDWRYGQKQNGMFIDGHEHEHVVKYRNSLVERWLEERGYEKRMILYDNDNNDISTPNGFPVEGGRFRLILVTHDESTFYANDCRKTKWFCSSEKAIPLAKSEGASIMVSDFLVPEWGQLKDDEDEAQILFRAGKNCDGYFTSEDLLKQVEKAIDIFESKTNGTATGLFMFDNAPSHQKCAPDALSARKMTKNPCEGWTHHKDGPRMHPGVLSDGSLQSFYFPNDHPTMPGWFKGMEFIIQERKLWPSSGLNAQCPGFKCEAGQTDCCC
ncbi:hypothetical protein M422DRAFT_170581 [Sphaerobolus stellatus SS14]|uniref:Uncharacterized protein n=1 Tax=Sphaerobolus stellatus (strain SS14) TaxID=990650 RepID=A0A0C9VWR8_SPHS4|nr:hypothetical protein M422DRAFT_170581 [Sphaerobolus stellatus SS14]